MWGCKPQYIHMEMRFLSVKTIPTDERNLHAATYHIGTSFKMTNVLDFLKKCNHLEQDMLTTSGSVDSKYNSMEELAFYNEVTYCNVIKTGIFISSEKYLLFSG